MKKTLIIIIINILFIGVIFIEFREKTSLIEQHRITENQYLIKKILSQDSAILNTKPEVFVSVIDSIQLNLKTSNILLLVYIPKDACWTCIQDKIKRTILIKNKYSIGVVFVTSYRNSRNFKITFPDEQSVVLKSDNNFFFTDNNSFLFVIYNKKENHYIPYFENSIVDPVDFIINNYLKNSYK
jgi:hypothetical protein